MAERRDTLSAGLRRLRLRHLEMLLAVERHPSLSAAAEALGVSQPTVSQWVAEVEGALGVPVFVRGRQLSATPYLAPVLRHARRIVSGSRRLDDELRAIRAGAGATVRIGAMPVAAAALLPRALVALRGDAPGLRVRLHEDIADGLWPKLEQAEIDLLVGRLDPRAWERGWRCETLHDDSHRVVAGCRHPLHERPAVDWATSARHPWILPPAGTPLRRAIDDTFMRRGLAPPSAWIEAAAPMTTQVLLRETDCLAVMSSAAARHFERAGLLRRLALSLQSDIGPVGAVWAEGTDAEVGVAAALASLRAAARSVAGELED